MRENVARISLLVKHGKRGGKMRWILEEKIGWILEEKIG
jgi:hypothetical protein